MVKPEGEGTVWAWFKRLKKQHEGRGGKMYAGNIVNVLHNLQVGLKDVKV